MKVNYSLLIVKSHRSVNRYSLRITFSKVTCQSMIIWFPSRTRLIVAFVICSWNSELSFNRTYFSMSVSWRWKIYITFVFSKSQWWPSFTLRNVSKNEFDRTLHVYDCWFETNWRTEFTAISIFGNVKNATKLPQYVVTTTKTTIHQVPTIIRPLSDCGKYIPPWIDDIINWHFPN